MYGTVADFYSGEIPEKYYDRAADFCERQILKNVKNIPEACRGEKMIVLDCGCGTGILTRKMALKGFDMIGLDNSGEMLEKAREEALKSPYEHLYSENIMWIRQDMTRMDLFGTVSCIISATDTVNHIITDRSMKRFAEKCFNFLDPGGLLIFDILTEEYFEKVINGNVFCHEDEDVTLIWQGRYNKKSRICTYDLTQYTPSPEKEGLWEKKYDLIREKAYSKEEITAILQKAGFEDIRTYSGYSGRKDKESDTRICFTARRR